ncbi:hypothetical protein HAX54_002423 [Datura stramonium]|uniref:F-box associated beta-propeller type 1 domain-containing protein n=1 Tax=Datura stramonium TaxID=4076 RepID=A0ABS8T4K6_DATST|nr:hypothetical protein [Datura stramonium]
MALISDPYFKMKHLNHAKNDRNSQKLFMSKMCFEKDDMFSFYSSSLSSVQVVEDEKKLDWPSNFKPVNTALYCCCDGLVVILVFDKLHRQLVLWNPSTGESMALPHPNFPQRSCVFGLGYDATSDDYKILAVNLNDMGQEASGEIFALKSGSWKKICQYPADIHRLIGFKDCGMNSLAFVHGAFHWVGLSGCYTIVSFNISNEVYGEIPLPEHMCNILDARFPEYVRGSQSMVFQY